jgi:hypothetical protein
MSTLTTVVEDYLALELAASEPYTFVYGDAQLAAAVHHYLFSHGAGEFARPNARVLLVGGAVVVGQVDVQEFVSQPGEVFLPAVVMPFHLGMAAVEMEPQQGYPLHDLDELLQATHGDRAGWIFMMKEAISKIAYYFNSQRMMRRYATEAYLR